MEPTQPGSQRSATVVLRDGRRVAVDFVGPERGPAVVLIHPAPGSRRFDPEPDATASAGIRLVTFDRAGYGGSEPLPEGSVPTIAAYADDAAAVLGDLGITEAVVVGWSAGGRIAAALAARHPQLVRTLVIAATPAPDDEVRWIPDEQRPLIDVMKADPAGSVSQLVEALKPMGTAPGHTLVATGDADAAALSDANVAEAIDTMVAEGFRQGVLGLAHDLISYTALPWGFDPHEVTAPTVCVYGVADQIVTLAHAAWWARKIDGAERWDVPAVGHLVLRPVWSRIIADLVGA